MEGTDDTRGKEGKSDTRAGTGSHWRDKGGQESTTVVQARNAERSRKAILDAATREFVTHGYSGASVNRIAAEAAINKRMLYHYFDSKDGLFLAVLEAAYERIRLGERELELAHLEPIAALRRLVEFSYDHLVEHPDFLALLNIENTHGAEHLKRSTRVRQMHLPLVDTLRTLLERGRSIGLLRSDVDAVDLYITIASLCFFHVSNQHTLSVIFDRELTTPAAHAERRELAVAVVTAYLRPPDR